MRVCSQSTALVLGCLLLTWLPVRALQASDTTVLVDAATEPFADAKTGKVLRAHRIVGDPPAVDGRLEDEAWQRAASIDDFIQWEPDNMAPLSERTVAQVAYDDRHIYIAVRAFESVPGGVTAGLGRRDTFLPTDHLEIGFDPRHDHQTSYVFQVNPSGVQGDFVHFDDQRVDRDYDAVWEVRTQVTSDGWTAEFQIPFSQMRFSVAPDQPTVWGFMVRREIHRRGEQGQWVGRPRGEQGNVSRWGHLVFEAPFVSPPRRLELLPYVLGGRTEIPASAEAEQRGGAGLDLRYGLGSAATLSATVNPDFGQVEQDPAVLNLSVFETFFPEKRPFFLEDSRTFVSDQGPFRLFHSRRIGRRPGYLSLESGDTVVDLPVETTILGAGKITGKTGGWTYGALTALTDREFAVVEADHDATGMSTGRAHVDRLIEPMTSFNVARLQRDVGASSNVGGLITAVVREGGNDAFTGGIDHNVRWNRSRWRWNGSYAITRAPGEGGVRTGVGGTGGLGFAAKHFSLNSFYNHIGSDFRVNDVGFLFGRTDQTQAGVGINLAQPDPWSIFRSVRGFVQQSRGWNGDGLQINRQTGWGLALQFRNFWQVNTFVGHGAPYEDDLDTRGGPPILRPRSTFLNMFVNSDSRKTWRINLGLVGRRDDAGGWSARFFPNISVQPSPRLQASLGVGYALGEDVAQWIANVDVTSDGEIDHVYGRLRRDVVDVTVRSTFAVNRDLTLEVFLQPFVAVGDYDDIRRLARPRTFEFDPVTLPYDPDFNSKSLRGNVVLRWEYLRGSTLFLVWNVSTFDLARPGVFEPWRDLGDAFRADGTHAFLVKMNYWWSR